MFNSFFQFRRWRLFYLLVILYQDAAAQTNLLLNGNFEDINTCTEYSAECGVEAWFYLSDVKIQMLENEDPSLLLGDNSFGLYYTWSPRRKFYPIIGTILPCRLRKGNRYIFSGLIKKEKLNQHLLMKPGVAMGEHFFVPNRPFAADMHADTINHLGYNPRNQFTGFEFSFVATGDEKYLTFGTFIEEDTLGSRTAFAGIQTVNVIVDNFSLVAVDGDESDCRHFAENKEKIYDYNYRHKEMDYALYGKGELPIDFTYHEPELTQPPPPLVKVDTLKLDDVLFDFGKSGLKPGAIQLLSDFFLADSELHDIDSIHIEGHTDSVGSDSQNMQLSLDRCESVKSWLIHNGLVEIRQTRVSPFGRTKPVASNRTAAGRALNRRVVLIIFRRVSS